MSHSVLQSRGLPTKALSHFLMKILFLVLPGELKYQYFMVFLREHLDFQELCYLV